MSRSAAMDGLMKSLVSSLHRALRDRLLCWQRACLWGGRLGGPDLSSSTDAYIKMVRGRFSRLGNPPGGFSFLIRTPPQKGDAPKANQVFCPHPRFAWD